MADDASRAGRSQLTSPSPLSFEQEWLWLLDHAMPGLSAYNVPRAVRIRGPLDVSVLERALAHVVDRHSVLRTHFPVGSSGEPVQVVTPPAPIQLVAEDFRDMPQAERHELVRARLRQIAQRPFDLARESLFRVTLLRVADDEHILSLLTHHIVSDGASREILLREVIAAYTALQGQEVPNLTPLSIQYAEFAAAQRARLRGEQLAAVVEYWKTQLADAPPALALPTDRARTSAIDFAGAQHSIELSKELADALQASAIHHGVTLHMLVLAAFQAFLHRYTGQDDIIVGCPVSGRDELTDGLIGFFANVLPFRVSCGDDPTFAALVARVADVCVGVYEHPEMPLEPLMQALRSAGRPAHAPLFQAMMVLEHDSGDLPLLGTATVDVLTHELEAVATDIALVVRAGRGFMRLSLQYRSDLFDAGTAARMLEHFLVLTEAAVQRPSTPVARLPLMSAAERELVVARWNATAAPYPSGRRVHEMIAERAAATPAATAVVCAGERLTFGELEARSNHLAVRLQHIGIEQGELVGVRAARAADTVISMLAVLKAGGAYVPLDPAYPADRLAFVGQDAKLRIIVGKHADEFGAIPDRILVRPDETVSGDRHADPIRSVASEIAYIMYTSGSTGTPKGVVVTHENLMASSWARTLYYEAPVGRFLLLSSFAFDSSVAGLYWTLMQGGTLVIPPEGTQLDVVALCALLRGEQITHLLALPSLYQELLTEAADADLESLRVVIVAGEPCPDALVGRHRERVPAAGFYNEYGLTEGTVWSSACAIEPADPVRRVTLGKPIPNTQLYIVDSLGEAVPIGVAGELHLGGSGITPGYLRRPELTAQRYIPSPFSPTQPGARLYRTGDRARWLANGEIEFLGRIDNQVKIHGHRVELGEIESALLRIPPIREAAVVVHGTGAGQRLVGYVTCAPAARDDLARMDTRQLLRHALPEYMVPSTVVVLDALPLSPNGKVDRQALAARGVADSEVYAAPNGPIEETIATAMADVLGVPNVGANHDFFTMGGTSLLAMRLMARLSRVLGIRLTWPMLFEASSVARLGRRVHRLLTDAHGGAAADETVPRLESEVAPLSFAQELLWLLDRATPGLNAYNVPMAFHVSGTLDVEALEAALSRLVERHGALRTTFGERSDGFVGQHVGAPRPIPVARVDLRGIDSAHRDDELTRRVREAIREPFDITLDVLLRATVYRLDDSESCLLLVSHHIVFDEFSSHVVVRELGALYAERVSGLPAALPDLPVRYGDYAAWQRESAARGALVPQLDYWRHRLRDLPTLALPTRGQRPVAPQFEGARRRYTLPAELLERVRHVGARHDATLYMTLLAAIKTVLYRYSGQHDIVVGAPITTRNREELEGLIGYFPNILVLRTSLDGDPTFAELLARVRATCVGGFAHQDVPQEKLILELRESGRRSTSPLVQVLFLLESRQSETVRFADASLRRMPVDFGTAKFDITVGMSETEDGLAVVFEYRTDLFDERVIDRMFGHVRVVLDAVSSDPDRTISDVPLLTNAEWQQSVVEWNATARPYPRDTLLHELVEAQAARTPAAVAVEDDREAVSFGALEARAKRIALALQARGVEPGQLVAIAAERSVDMVVGLLGILIAGGAYVPIDPDHPAERIKYMLDDSGATVLLTQRRLLARVASTERASLLLDDDASIAEERATVSRDRDSRRPAYMIYTSGSTGRPKGALNAHAGIVNRLLWMQDEFKLTERDVVLQKTPFSFDVSVWELFWPLLTGARLVMARPGGHRDALYLAEVIRSRGVTVCHFVPSMLRAFLANDDANRSESLRDVMASGEALPPDLVAAFHRALPATRLHNLYGPTECAVDVTSWSCPQTSEPPLVVPIGRPVANTQTYVLNDRLRPAPVGVPGELYLAGRQVGLGYHRRDELTRERFIADPFSGDVDARMYRTGDRARWLDDGTLEYLGRLDHQVKVRGFRIELGEIEETLRQHPAVQDVAVMAHDDGGDSRLVAYIVPRSISAGVDVGASVERWREVFDHTYAQPNQAAAAPEPGFNTAGWVSSYDKQPIPAREMREWVDRTCERIVALRPRRVLEIGCGTGLLLFRIAPGVESYHGLDISAAALEAIRSDPAFSAIADRVTLRQARADETEELPPASFDTVVINSVAQYFPSADYLVQVLERAMRLVSPGGAIFVGDVRALPLLEVMHTSVARRAASDDTAMTDLRATAQQRIWHESELVVDPVLFEVLRLHLPRIADVEVLLKRGHAVNELTKFRCDVVLYLDAARTAIPADATPAAQVDSLDAIRKLLSTEPAALRLPGLVDGRIMSDVDMHNRIMAAPAHATVREVCNAQSGVTGIEPEALAELHPDYEVALLWPESMTVGRFDAVFRHRRKQSTSAPVPPRAVRERPWSDLVHHPPAESFSDEEVGGLRAHLGNTLPEYMLPSVFVRLAAMPLTPSGKLDRRALHLPVVTRALRTYVAPRTATEARVAAIWADVLRVERVGVEDRFVDLGGHSLLAMRVVGRVRRETGATLGIDTLLRDETAAQFAALIDQARATAPVEDDDVPMTAVSRDAFRRGPQQQ